VAERDRPAPVRPVHLDGVWVEELAVPLISVMPFLRIRKWTPLTRPSATLRLRACAGP